MHLVWHRTELRTHDHPALIAALELAKADNTGVLPLVIIDSIQTLWTDRVESAPGTVTQVRTSAQALTRFAKGDSFVAEGYVHTFQFERDGEFIQREEFVAKKIGHDLARTNYQVIRTNRPAPGSEQDAALAHRVAAG